METLESALRMLLEHTVPVTETETLPLADASGRVCAQDIVSPIAVPPFDRSPLDGYALHSEDLKGASRERPVRLRVIGEADALCEGDSLPRVFVRAVPVSGILHLHACHDRIAG